VLKQSFERQICPAWRLLFEAIPIGRLHLGLNFSQFWRDWLEAISGSRNLRIMIGGRPRHDTPHEKSLANCWFSRLASSSNGGSSYPRGQNRHQAENRRGQGTLQPFFGENRMSWKGEGSGSENGRAAYPLVMTTSLPWKITMLLMGKSTISMAIFNSYVSLPQGRWC